MQFFKISLLLILVTFFSESMLGQSDNNTPIGEEAIRAVQAVEAIKEGTMIVILVTNAKKINSIISTLRAKNLNPNLKKRLKDQLFDTVVKTKRQNEYLIEFYKQYYTFSDLRFAFDTSVVQLKNGNFSNVFVNQELQISDTIQLSKPIGGFFKIGRANNLGTGILAMLVCDKQNKVLDSPFPYNIVLPDSGSLDSEKENFAQVIERTSSRIENFYHSERTKLYRN